MESEYGILDGHKAVIQLLFLFGLFDDNVGCGNIPNRKGLSGGQVGQRQLVVFKKQSPAAFANGGVIYDTKAESQRDQ